MLQHQIGHFPAPCLGKFLVAGRKEGRPMIRIVSVRGKKIDHVTIEPHVDETLCLLAKAAEI
jgi:hypothetical protein